MIDLKKVVIKEKKVDTILTKSNLPIAGYSINPYVGCPFGCEYCYALQFSPALSSGRRLAPKHWTRQR